MKKFHYLFLLVLAIPHSLFGMPVVKGDFGGGDQPPIFFPPFPPPMPRAPELPTMPPAPRGPIQQIYPTFVTVSSPQAVQPVVVRPVAQSSNEAQTYFSARERLESYSSSSSSKPSRLMQMKAERERQLAQQDAINPVYPLEEAAGAYFGTPLVKAGYGALKAICFTGATPVCVANVDCQNIAEFQAGDIVESWNLETGTSELKPILQVFKSTTDHILKLYYGNAFVETTDNHPFYVIGKGFVEAWKLVKGDQFKLITGESVAFDHSEIVCGEFPVYNLEVQGNNNYFAGGILAHNCNLDRARDSTGVEATSGQKLIDQKATGRNQPRDLKEKLAMDQVMAQPEKGEPVGIELKDSRFPSTEGWEKMRQVVETTNAKGQKGKVVIHYNYNSRTGASTDYKFK